MSVVTYETGSQISLWHCTSRPYGSIVHVSMLCLSDFRTQATCELPMTETPLAPAHVNRELPGYLIYFGLM
ncbi:hypothetical protein CSKR_202781 [Clonorchis sinensis]|uniref:Uncharacterized protein n=1 Tax=Clonorchis sinensis TaxID=79923 RepID=A0A8T1M3F9_CLOSI|nr:hypothetical protein CSKR_202781 [Clonorchis sinensis]